MLWDVFYIRNKNVIYNFFSFVKNRLFSKILRELRYRKRLKEIKKRDPFIY